LDIATQAEIGGTSNGSHDGNIALSATKKYDCSILIVVRGTWGCSTGLHLAKRHYRNVTVLDANELPAPISAGSDINKIVEQGTISRPKFLHS
jgi:hypothetical protein